MHSHILNKLSVDISANFKPKLCGANSTALTVPFASDNTALSTQQGLTGPQGGGGGGGGSS